MVVVRFQQPDGSEATADVEVGMSVMEGAIAAGIDGIDADCGGQLSCATCHVYVDETWFDQLDHPSSDEAEMLTGAVEPQANSRLCCQIKVVPGLEGLVLRVPASQHG